MKLSLTKPLVFFDLETTGVDPFTDRIVQLAAIKFIPDGSRSEINWLFNPGMPIPKGASDVHGITDDMVADKPAFGDFAAELSALFDGADFGGYNVKNFDMPLLLTEFDRIGLSLDPEAILVVDAMKIFQVKEPRTLTAAYKKYCGKELVDAHDALADIKASVAVFEGQMTYYDDIPDTVEAIHEFCFPKDPDGFDADGKLRFVDGELTINFGKNKGKFLKDLAMHDRGYLEWILNSRFSDKVKGAVKEALDT